MNIEPIKNEQLEKYGEDIKSCRYCRFRDCLHLKGGTRRVCNVDGHKIKKGKSNCKDFQWD